MGWRRRRKMRKVKRSVEEREGSKTWKKMRRELEG